MLAPKIVDENEAIHGNAVDTMKRCPKRLYMDTIDDIHVENIIKQITIYQEIGESKKEVEVSLQKQPVTRFGVFAVLMKGQHKETAVESD